MSTKKLILGEDYTICDMCMNFQTNMSGTQQICDVRMTDKNIMETGYFEERLNGNKTSCKEFKRLFAAKKIKEMIK